jgi:hypothetical protein
LSAASSAFSVPATCTIPAGATGTTACSGTAGSVTSSTVVQVAATYNSSLTANLTVLPPQ